MGETLNEQCRVNDEGPMGCKVPAAAVIRREQALSGFIGRKGCVGGLLSMRLKPEA